MGGPVSNCNEKSREIYQEAYDRCMGSTDKTVIIKNDECKKIANKRADEKFKECQSLPKAGGEELSPNPYRPGGPKGLKSDSAANALSRKLNFIAGNKGVTVLEEGKTHSDAIAKGIDSKVTRTKDYMQELGEKVVEFRQLEQTFKSHVDNTNWAEAKKTADEMKKIHQRIDFLSATIKSSTKELQGEMDKYDHVLEHTWVDTINGAMDGVSSSYSNFNDAYGSRYDGKYTSVYDSKNARELMEAVVH